MTSHEGNPAEFFARGVRELAGYNHMETLDYALCLCAYYLRNMHSKLVEMEVELKYIREEIRDK